MSLPNKNNLGTLTIKQENFALAFVQNGSMVDTYKEVYAPKNMSDKSARTESARIRNHPKVAKRIAELQEENRKKNEITIEYITNGLKKAIALATSKEDASNLRQAYMDLAKLHGLLIEKRVVDTTIKINKPRGEIAERFARRFNVDNIDE
jgi:hypothetical protein